MQRKLLVRYFIVTYLASWLLWIPMALQSLGLSEYSVCGQWLLRAGTFAPSVLAFMFIYGEQGKKGAKKLLLKGFKMPFNWTSVSYIFLLIPALAMCSYLIASCFLNLNLQFSIPTRFIIPAFFLILFLMGPLGEEFGWRGYALDRLIAATSPFYASIMLGFVWTMWHLPLFFITGTIQHQMAEQGLFIVLIGYLWYTIMLTLLMTFLHLKTKGSVLAAILFHTISNLTQGVIPLLSSNIVMGIFLAVMLMVTIALISWQRAAFLHKSKSHIFDDLMG